MWGLALDRDATPVVQAALQQGLLVNRTAERVIRLLPPYVITEHEMDEGLRLLDAALAEAPEDRHEHGQSSVDRRRVTSASAEGIPSPCEVVGDADAIAQLIEPISRPVTCCRAAATTSLATRRGSWCRTDGRIVGCAELAPLSRAVAEVRSLVVDEALARTRARQPADRGSRQPRAPARFCVLCAFAHDPRHFLRLGFSIVPHVWFPEKIALDCTGCAKFRSVRSARAGAGAHRPAGCRRSPQLRRAAHGGRSSAGVAAHVRLRVVA